VRKDTYDCNEVRWEILKSMLDSFPQLLDRAERYILEKKSLIQTVPESQNSSGVKELVQKAVKEYRKERRLLR